MDRRAFLQALAGGLLAAPLAAQAQQSGKVYRVGYLNPGSSSDPVRQRRLEALRQGLRELGYVEGQNIALELRWAEGKYDRYPRPRGGPGPFEGGRHRGVEWSSDQGRSRSDQDDPDRHVARQ